MNTLNISKIFAIGILILIPLNINQNHCSSKRIPSHRVYCTHYENISIKLKQNFAKAKPQVSLGLG